jgi:hypothetical protein
MADEEIGQWRVENARRVELLAGDGRTDDGKYPRADDRANAQSRQRPRPEGLLEAVLWLFRVPDELVD